MRPYLQVIFARCNYFPCSIRQVNVLYLTKPLSVEEAPPRKNAMEQVLRPSYFSKLQGGKKSLQNAFSSMITSDFQLKQAQAHQKRIVAVVFQIGVCAELTNGSMLACGVPYCRCWVFISFTSCFHRFLHVSHFSRSWLLKNTTVSPLWFYQQTHP